MPSNAPVLFQEVRAGLVLLSVTLETSFSQMRPPGTFLAPTASWGGGTKQRPLLSGFQEGLGLAPLGATNT